MLLAGVTVASSVVVVAGPARAADSVQCGATATVFATSTAGIMYQYPLHSPASDPADYGAGVTMSGGWNDFGRILAGPDGRVYGLNATGMYLYRWTGSGWSVQRKKISDSFGSFATAAHRNRITVDESGDFYLLDGVGRLLRYRYDEASGTWSTYGQLVATGWGHYDLIVAGSAGVLYARTPGGQLFRFRYDATSQRVIQPVIQVGSSSWNGFTKGIFSVGGDTLFGIQADGDQFQYRYREDTGTWAVPGRLVGSGWQSFANVFAITNTCRLTVSHTPARPNTPVVPSTPVAVRQAPAPGGGIGPVDYAYSDNSGRLWYGRHFTVASPVNWVPAPGNDTFTGTPALVYNAQDFPQIAGQNTYGDHLSVISGGQGWQSRVNIAGAMKYPPAMFRLPNNTMVIFGVDANGSLWVRTQDSVDGVFLPWRNLGSTGAGLVGTPLLDEGPNGSLTLVAADAAGTIHTSRYASGTLTAWTSLGGSGFTGAPSVIRLPGYRLRIFARAASGEIMMRKFEPDGTTPGDWSPVGSFTAAGAPSAILDFATGRMAVTARGTDNEVYVAFETGQATEAWNSWNRINPNASDPAASDPTAAKIAPTGGSSESWIVVFRDSNDQIHRYDRSTTAIPPAFTARTLSR